MLNNKDMKAKRNCSKLNICMITSPFTDMVGETILKDFVKILEPLSKEIFVITGKFSDISNSKVHILSLKTAEKIESAIIRIIKFALTDLRISFNLIKLYKNIDVVIFYIGARMYVISMLSAQILRKRTIVIAAGSAAMGAKNIKKYNSAFSKEGITFPWIYVLEHVNYVLTDIIGTLIESKALIHNFGLEKYRHKIMPFTGWFVDTNIFKIKKKFGERENVIGYLGRLSREKGVLELAKAIPLILAKKDDVKFLIVGDGPLMTDMKRELEEVGCIDKVEFVGWIPHEQIPDYLNKMKVHILPSYIEAFGGAGLEAMACGTISITNSVGGIPDIITDGETGFLLKDNQPQTIADKVLEIWVHPELDEIQRNAEEFVEKTFSYEKAMERCKKVFCELVDA